MPNTDYIEKWLDQMAVPGNEGGTTGKRTRIKASDGSINTATGRWQITDKTRDAILYSMGNKTQASLDAARKRFKTDPAFERQVARQHLVTINNSLPSNVTDLDRVRAWTKAWYTGNPNHPDNVIPHPEKGNKITAGYYADKIAYQLGLGPKPDESKKSIKGTTSSTTPAGTTITMDNNTSTVTPTNVQKLSRLANEGVITRLDVPTVPKLKTTPLKIGPVQTTTLPTSQTTPTMATSSDTKKYNAKSLKPLTGMEIMPYLSNLYSSTVRPPAVPNPILASPVSLQRVSMDVDRSQVEGDYRDTLRTSDLADVGTSIRSKLAAKAMKFGQLSKINEGERNANIEIANREQEANKAVMEANRQALYNKQLMDVERQNAIISQNTANVSNLTDKLIAEQARRDQENLETQRLDILANYDTFGNLRKYMESKKAMGGRLYTAGRFMKTLKPIKTIK